MHGVELIISRIGSSHGIEGVAVLLMDAGADDTVIRGVPRVGMPQTFIMAQLMACHSCTVLLQPYAFSAHGGESTEVEIGNPRKGGNVAIIIHGVVTGSARHHSGVLDQRARAGGAVPAFALRQRQ